ncbi:f-box/LRR-repeat protein 13 [Danaus plexippus plexippus]|uniref:F-box/LRR-repeat protein 13 n=2 Tax=Danaus plexippus TaxID=13037 RepID=A0A212F7B6_DANPL|nr:f-box/LRR-repeat protein 13 [Danaus plexippus plexippus]
MYIYSVIKFVIDQCENLISLELVMCRIGKDFEYDILKWPNLKKLNLRNSILLSSNIDLMVPFENFCHLQYLALSDFGLSSLNCDSLLGCNYLTHILIEKIKGLGLEFINKLILSKQKIIKTLHIYGGNSINDYTLKLLSNCVSLNDLAIVRCENLTDKGFISLTQLNNLQHLQIWNNNNFTETGILQVLGSPSIKQLKSLSLSRIQNVTPVSVDLLSEYYKNLKFLALYHCPKIIHTDYEKQLKSKFRNIDVVLY